MMSEWAEDTGRWASLTAEELSLAMEAAGILKLDVAGDEDGVSISFPGLAPAEALMTLAVGGDRTPGSLGDRASGSCATLAQLASDYAVDVPDELLAAAFHNGWDWVVHPHMTGRTVGWHVTVTMSTADASQVAANLYALKHGGAL